MSFLKKNSDVNTDRFAKLDSALTKHYTGATDQPELASATLSMEANASHAAMQSNAPGLLSSIIASVNTGGVVAENPFLDAGVECATIAAMSCEDNKTWLKRLNFNSLPGDVDKRLSLESFEKVETMKEYRNATIAYNLGTVEMAKGLAKAFPAEVVSPNEIGKECELTFPVSLQGTGQFEAGADAPDIKEVSLNRIQRDASMLNDLSLDVLAFNTPDNAPYLITDADFGSDQAIKVNVNGTEAGVRPMRWGVGGGLLALALNNDIPGKSTYDRTDVLAGGGRIGRMLVRITSKSDNTKTITVPVSVATHSTSLFLAARQGDTSNTVVNLETTGTIIENGTKNLAGDKTVESALGAIAGADMITVAIEATVKLNIKTTVYTPKHADVAVSGGSLAGNPVGDQDPSLKAWADAHTIEVAGWEYQGKLTNSNDRMFGDVFDEKSKTELYNVEFQSPVSLEAPENGMAGNSLTGKTLNELAKVSREHRGYTKVLERIGEIRGAMKVHRPEFIDGVADIQGLARYLVIPHLVEDVIDFTTNAPQNEKESELRADINELVLNTIRHGASHAIYKSDSRLAARRLKGTYDVKPTLHLMMPELMANYMQLDGDEANGGELFGKIDIATVEDSRFYKVDKDEMIIVGHFSWEGVPELNFGRFRVVPTPISERTILRNGANRKETTVYPRYEFFGECPVAIYYVVKGASKLFKGKAT